LYIILDSKLRRKERRRRRRRRRKRRRRRRYLGLLKPGLGKAGTVTYSSIRAPSPNKTLLLLPLSKF
jgi:hypothetical protein